MRILLTTSCMFSLISQSKSKHNTFSNQFQHNVFSKIQHSTAIMIFEIANMHAHLLYEMEIQLKLPILTLLSATSPTILTPNAQFLYIYIYRNLINSITFFCLSHLPFTYVMCSAFGSSNISECRPQISSVK